MPRWQSRGYAVVWERYLKEGHNTMTGEKTTTERRRLAVDLELPEGPDYDAYLLRLLDDDSGARRRN